MYTSQTKPAYHESAKAAKILLDTIYDITDGNVKKALETAIETLFLDAMDDWHKSDTKLSAIDYLGLTEKDYAYWLLGEDRNIFKQEDNKIECERV